MSGTGRSAAAKGPLPAVLSGERHDPDIAAGRIGYCAAGPAAGPDPPPVLLHSIYVAAAAREGWR